MNWAKNYDPIDLTAKMFEMRNQGLPWKRIAIRLKLSESKLFDIRRAALKTIEAISLESGAAMLSRFNSI